MPATSNAVIDASAAAICLATVNISGIAITNESEVFLKIDIALSVRKKVDSIIYF